MSAERHVFARGMFERFEDEDENDSGETDFMFPQVYFDILAAESETKHQTIRDRK